MGIISNTYNGEPFLLEVFESNQAKKIEFALNNYQIIKNKTDKAFLNLKEFFYENQCKKYEDFINKFYVN